MFKAGINNIVRHPHCTEADVEFSVEGEWLLLCLKDNGKGFDTAQARNGHGLRSMIGLTGAPQFFMDLTFDCSGNMFGVTTTINFNTHLPAVLYRIDPATGTAPKVVNLVGSNSVMGLAFDQNGKLYGTDFVQNLGLYLIDIKTGFETAVAALPFFKRSRVGEPRGRRGRERRLTSLKGESHYA